jgi:hypothetical protein
VISDFYEYQVHVIVATKSPVSFSSRVEFSNNFRINSVAYFAFQVPTGSCHWWNSVSRSHFDSRDNVVVGKTASIMFTTGLNLVLQNFVVGASHLQK